MEFQRPPSCYAFGKVIRPEPKSLGRIVIPGMSFRIYRLAKNQAGGGDSVRGIVQIIITRECWKRSPDAGAATPRLPGCSTLNLQDSNSEQSVCFPQRRFGRDACRESSVRVGQIEPPSVAIGLLPCVLLDIG